MHDKLAELRQKVGEVADISAAIALLQWDQEVYMPPKGGEARGNQTATLSALAHRLFISDDLGRLLRDLHENASQLEPDDRRLVAETLYDYARATKLPEQFVHTLAEAQSRAFQAWASAKKKSDFGEFLPHLSNMIDLQKQKADLLGYEGTPYNALLEDYERGMTADRLRQIFSVLRPRLTDLVGRIVDSPRQADLSWLAYMKDDAHARAAKWEFTIRLLRDMGYDFDAGRQDMSAHPFTTSFDIHDVRVTTRPDFDELFWYSSLHEGGHALYEQGHLEKDRRTVLAQGPSLGIHESQSRLWENIIGRSLPYCRYATPIMRSMFPDLSFLTPEALYQSVNHVEPSLIRTEADEVTYNLHIILRFELELDLIEGRLAARDVPRVWNETMKEYLGVTVPDDAHGCLQDVHWSHGSFGYFPTYTLGNLYSAQIFEAAIRDLPELWAQIERGEFSPLLAWLREKIHRVGRRKTAPEIVRDVTGEDIEPEVFLDYLEKKFGGIYGV